MWFLIDKKGGMAAYTMIIMMIGRDARNVSWWWCNAAWLYLADGISMSLQFFRFLFYWCVSFALALLYISHQSETSRLYSHALAVYLSIRVRIYIICDNFQGPVSPPAQKHSTHQCLFATVHARGAEWGGTGCGCNATRRLDRWDFERSKGRRRAQGYMYIWWQIQLIIA